MAGLRDRIGMDIDAKQIEFIKTLNANQASNIIKVLSGISFYNQRVMISEALESLKHREDFDVILDEVKCNIHRKEWFELNKDLLAMSYELQEPTDAQVRRIADVAKYIFVGFPMISVILQVLAATNSANKYGIGLIFDSLA